MITCTLGNTVAIYQILSKKEAVCTQYSEAAKDDKTPPGFTHKMNNTLEVIKLLQLLGW